MFPLNQWYVAGFLWEFQDKPIARTLLNHPVVLFRTEGGTVAALEDRCCHRSLPLSSGTLEERGLRCGYHGMLYASSGACLEIPGQDKIPSKACVRAYVVSVRNQIVWIWMPDEPGGQPDCEAPEYAVHDDPRYRYRGDVYHYDAPYQLIHDNLLDLSHLGYVHLRTIGGNAKVHMNAETKVEEQGDVVRVLRYMPSSLPPPTYTAAWRFPGLIDRWQEIEFDLSHLRIWTGAEDAGTGSMRHPDRGGFHMRGFHGVTPETNASTHYFWTVATNRHPEMPDMTDTVYEQSALTFEEDKVVIEAQYRNMQRFSGAPQIDLRIDAGPNRARRIIDRLTRDS